MGNTAIEWATKGWPLVTGCTPKTEGCRECWAARLGATRLKHLPLYEGLAEMRDGRGVWKGIVRLNPAVLDEPLSWRKPQRVFVAPEGDLFHDKVPDSFILRVWWTMMLAKRHTFMVLTKRADRMLSFVTGLIKAGAEGPLPNVWLGVSAENQAAADERIPLLLKTPAALRFVSAEPLVGPIDLSKWLLPVTPMQPEQAPKTWAEWQWPDWVPADTRSQIEHFWSESMGRSPKRWLENALQNGAPPFGIQMTYEDPNSPCEGRWIHCWNNIGRLVGDDGIARLASIPRTSLFDTTRHNWQPLNWVIIGTESGPKRRSMDINWADSLVHQCQVAGTAVFVKQVEVNGQVSHAMSEWPVSLRYQQFPAGGN